MHGSCPPGAHDALINARMDAGHPDFTGPPLIIAKKQAMEAPEAESAPQEAGKSADQLRQMASDLLETAAEQSARADELNALADSLDQPQHAE